MAAPVNKRLSMYHAIADLMNVGDTMEASVDAILDDFLASSGKFVPGFGDRFHPMDPRAPRLLELVDVAVRDTIVSGRFASIASMLEVAIEKRKNRRIPMNIDGATAVIYAELGFPPPLARGLFCLSRAVGILAHAWEQTQQGGRNKGPLPMQYIWSYDGPQPHSTSTPNDSEKE
jgi:citrate synthase